MTDAGSENVNRDVDHELSGANLERVLAQIDVTYSNSMIEAFWRSLKNSWLYLHGLESESGLRRLIAFYVQAHNEVMPHSAFNGQTPDEVFFGRVAGHCHGDETAGQQTSDFAALPIPQ